MSVVAFVIALAVLIAMVLKGVGVWLALLTAGVLITILTDPLKLPLALAATAGDGMTWFLVAMSALIALLAESYRRTGLTDELGRGFSQALRSVKLSIVVVPAVMGLLPVAGGALMSAPVVGALGNAAGLTSVDSAVANVWFRHMFLLIYPISDIIVLASSLSGVPVEDIVVRQILVAAALTALGYAVILRSNVRQGRLEADLPRKPLIVSAAPLLTALGAALTVRYAVNPLLMPVGVAVGVLVIGLTRGAKAITASFKSKKIYSIALAGFAAMFVKYSLELSGVSQAVVSALPEGVNALLIVSVLPFAVGLFAGSVTVALTIGMSLVLGVGAVNPFTVNVVYIASFLGYLASPTHLCLIYTAEYFGVPLSKPYRKLAPLVFASLLLSVAILGAIRPII